MPVLSFVEVWTYIDGVIFALDGMEGPDVEVRSRVLAVLPSGTSV
jgi:hypothetical protein